MAEPPTSDVCNHSIERSKELKSRSIEIIPNATQTNSKAPSRWVQGVSPAFVERGDGCHVWDVDGNRYVDYLMACGPIVLGHNYHAVSEAIEDQLHDGIAYSVSHPLEIEVAERVIKMVPCAEMVRFAKNGNDVTQAAARVARAYTDKTVIATHGYHGWPDIWAAASGGNGVPKALEELTVPFEWNDIESVERIFEEHPDDVAAIVTTATVWEPPENDFLKQLREIADREEALLIFDEVLTGFRFAPGGAQEYYGVMPDLACFAKAIANGMPLAALAGRADLMRTLENEVSFSLTYGGETLSLAAARATLDVLHEEPVHEHLFEIGAELKNGYNDVASKHGLSDRTWCRGLEPFSNVVFRTSEGTHDAEAKTLFMQECHKRGILFCDTHIPCYSHSNAEIERTIEVYYEAMATLADAIAKDDVKDRIEGKIVGASVRE